MSAYPFIGAEKAEGGNVAKACALMEVSRSAYYEWSKQRPSRRQLADAELLVKVVEVFDASRGTYGWPRVHAALRRAGICASRKRVARLMAQAGLVGRCRRKKTRTTFSDPEAKALDLVRRVFGPGAELDRTWVGDLTYVRTWQGWLYLATVIDLASRRVVGWAMADHMRAELACDALSMALAARRPGPGLIFHSDRGGQYSSDDFTKLLKANSITQSFSRPAQCWDNAVGESWFSTLKTELVHRYAWPTRAQARQAIFEFIEVFYNRQRLHSSLGMLSPVEYEHTLTLHQQSATQAA
jgi:transposase InsO family protein